MILNFIVNIIKFKKAKGNKSLLFEWNIPVKTLLKAKLNVMLPAKKSIEV